MYVTSINKKGSYVVVAFDNEESVKLPVDIFIKSGLRKNDEVTEKFINDLKKEVDYYNVKDSAYRFLSRRDHSIKELRLKLIKKKFDKDLIDKVLDHLQEFNYLNDEKFAVSYYNELVKNKLFGTNRIKNELYKKGVSREIIESVVREEHEDDNFYENAKILASKKISQIERKESDTIKIKQKLYSYLTNKGYSGEIISKIFEEFGLSQ
jgi:regulatory protein